MVAAGVTRVSILQQWEVKSTCWFFNPGWSRVDKIVDEYAMFIVSMEIMLTRRIFLVIESFIM